MISTFNFFGKTTSMLMLFSLLGMVVSVLMALYLSKKRRISTEDTFYMLVFSMIGCFIGAKLFYIWISVDHLWLGDLSFLQNLTRFSQIILNGGMVFYGGLIGAISGAIIYLKAFHIPIFLYIDTLYPIIPLFHVFGRLGCYFTGCCHGCEYNGVFHVTYINSMVAINHQGYFPVQLVEVGFNAILFVILTYLSFNKTKWKQGRGIGLYLLCYSMARFLLEFLRGDEIRGGFLIFSSSQWISLLLVPIALFVMFRREK